jgi:hypothetical protein
MTKTLPSEISGSIGQQPNYSLENRLDEKNPRLKNEITVKEGNLDVIYVLSAKKITLDYNLKGYFELERFIQKGKKRKKQWALLSSCKKTIFGKTGIPDNLILIDIFAFNFKSHTQFNLHKFNLIGLISKKYKYAFPKELMNEIFNPIEKELIRLYETAGNPKIN